MSTRYFREACQEGLHRRAGLLFLTVFSLVSVLIGVKSSGSAEAASNGLWSVFPTTHAGESPRPFVEPELTPGKAYADSVTVANYTAAPLDFHIYSSDAINTAGGGLSLRPRTAVQLDIGGWIHLPYSTLRVPAHAAIEVPFTINPPQQAAPGDHVGGIVAEDVQGTSSKSGSAPVTVVQAVGVRVYGHVVGALHPRLALPQMSVTVDQSIATQFSTTVDARVTFQVHNSGNTVLSPMATVRLSSPLGTAATKRFLVNEILPGNSLGYRLRFSGLTTYGHLRVQVSVIGRGATASKASTVWTVPWALLVLVVLALVLVVWVLVRWRRRRGARVQPDEIQTADSVDV